MILPKQPSDFDVKQWEGILTDINDVRNMPPNGAQIAEILICAINWLNGTTMESERNTESLAMAIGRYLDRNKEREEWK